MSLSSLKIFNQMKFYYLKSHNYDVCPFLQCLFSHIYHDCKSLFLVVVNQWVSFFVLTLSAPTYFLMNRNCILTRTIPRIAGLSRAQNPFWMINTNLIGYLKRKGWAKPYQGLYPMFAFPSLASITLSSGVIVVNIFLTY